MGIEERREREREARRNSIIRAAMGVYWDEGYHATTMERIAERAELSRATLYLHFKTKDEIFVHGIAAHGDYFGDLLEELGQGLDRLDTPFLPAIWECFQRFYRKDPVAFNASLYFHQSEMIRNLPKALRDLLDRAGSRNYRLLCGLMNHALEKAWVRPCDPQTLAEVIWTAFLGIVHLENSKAAMGRRQHLEVTWELALSTLQHGLNPESSQPGAARKELDIHLR